MRAAELHVNCVRLLEVAPCTDCLRVQNIQLLPDNVFQGDLVLRHPFASGNLKLSGFDVRAIFIGEADYTWPVSGRRMAVGDDVARLLNPDGYTSLFNPTEFPPTSPPALGYIPGHLAYGGDLTATLNPYVAYQKGQPRRVFRFGETSTETIRLRFPDGPLEFGYAIDACWQTFPGPCVDPVVDFPHDANCLEAYEISVWAGPGLSLDPDAWTWVYAVVYDHQGAETIDEVTVEIPDVISGTIELDYYQQRSDGGYIYKAKVRNELGVGTGDYPYLVRVVDTAVDQNLGPIDAWFPGSLPVRKGWVLTWGGDWSDYAHDIVVNGAGDIFVLGDGCKNTDYDPSPGQNLQDDKRYTYISKFDWGGGFEWVDRWESMDVYYNGGLALDSEGYVYMTGVYWGTVDFDPGPGVVEHTSYADPLTGYYEGNLFLLKLNPDGDLIWVVTWTSPGYIRPKGLVNDGATCVYVTGWFEGVHDFDPGPEVEEHESQADYSDAFLIKVTTDGTYEWARVWGGESYTRPTDAAVDGAGNAVVSGYFEGIVDMDPGPGEDIHDSEVWSACFFSKFSSDGEFQWARSLTTGCGYSPEFSPAVAIDSSDNIFIADEFRLLVDFDPGTEMDVRVSNGYADVFLTKYDPDGDYLWVLTWGGEYGDETDYFAIDSLGDVYIGGGFGSTVDFDPGPGLDERTSAKFGSAFLSRFDTEGNYCWVATWEERRMGYTIASDHIGNVYLGFAFGWNGEGLDFDPGPTTEFRRPEGPQINNVDAFLLKMPYDFYWW